MNGEYTGRGRSYHCFSLNYPGVSRRHPPPVEQQSHANDYSLDYNLRIDVVCSPHHKSCALPAYIVHNGMSEWYVYVLCRHAVNEHIIRL